ncbi:NitT/TauT family transport system ATP-binding protein [Sagittula marina]|uniref:NitT/TauT family transport system ATP-binding protein n=1 Tax=Sagittula marina TaxID=943940 RepID=A0A7W6DRE9_9RHOB|nr:ATP-binding cassette domain-containing protein [Sagittula marina]MBB3987414.1 NitT/TauT family transport system ATP-binding protein [Sagittula marina]
MIRVDIRAKHFGPTQVLGTVRFDIAPGETVALVGPSGIGKSTVLRIVAGIDNRFEGNVTRPDAMAIVFQEPTLLPWRSARDNLLLTQPGLSRDGAERALTRVGLEGRGDAFPGHLSLGQQRRLSLARAFAGSPELLIMDEPFVSLDPDMADQMIGLSEALIAEHRPATLFVTHARSEADRLADRVLELSGTPASLTN